MTDQQHPITPPPELVQQWRNSWHDTRGEFGAYITTQAARWGSDQELEAVITWMQKMGYWGENAGAIPALRAARRPKLPSLREQALAALNEIEDKTLGPTTEEQLIRKALEALPND